MAEDVRLDTGELGALDEAVEERSDFGAVRGAKAVVVFCPQRARIAFLCEASQLPHAIGHSRAMHGVHILGRTRCTISALHV